MSRRPQRYWRVEFWPPVTIQSHLRPTLQSLMSDDVSDNGNNLPLCYAGGVDWQLNLQQSFRQVKIDSWVKYIDKKTSWRRTACTPAPNFLMPKASMLREACRLHPARWLRPPALRSPCRWGSGTAILLKGSYFNPTSAYYQLCPPVIVIGCPPGRRAAGQGRGPCSAQRLSVTQAADPLTPG